MPLFARHLLLAFTLMPLAAPCTLAAQGSDKDIAELEHTTLTMDTVTRFYETVKELDPLVQANPALAKKLEPDADRHESLDQAEARLVSDPRIPAILVRHGFTPRQFLLIELVSIQTALASTLKPADESNAEYAARVRVNPANLDFLQLHKAELDAMLKSAGATKSSD